MGPPPRSFAADAHECIMVRVPGPTEYKVVARLICAPESGLPSDRHPDRIECAAVLRAVKVWPGKGRARGKVGATANLDSSCARRLCNTAGRGEETGFQVEQRNRSRKQEREIAALKPLDNKDPIQGTQPVLVLHVEAWRRSCLSRTEYCRRHGLKKKTFDRWMKHLIGVEEARRHGEELRELRQRAASAAPKDQ